MKYLFHDRDAPARGLRPGFRRSDQRQTGVDAAGHRPQCGPCQNRIAFLERVLHKDCTHYRPRGILENRAVPEEPQDRPRGIRLAGCR